MSDADSRLQAGAWILLQRYSEPRLFWLLTARTKLRFCTSLRPTVLHHHESHLGDLSASVLTSYSHVELPLWLKERVESCLKAQNR